MTITSLLADHHTFCDDLFVSTEAACVSGDWVACARQFKRLADETASHFTTEEELLFPAFERATGMTSGPTEMMRIEHRQMRELLAEMHTAAEQQNEALFRGNADTLLILMQQHNMKEENILYPMCDRTLAGADLVEQLETRLKPLCLV